MLFWLKNKGNKIFNSCILFIHALVKMNRGWMSQNPSIPLIIILNWTSLQMKKAKQITLNFENTEANALQI
jgi:hypothetical protein